MILLHRITPFIVAIVTAVGFYLTVTATLHPLITMAGTVLFVSLLLARLLQWDITSFRFWHFLVTPVFFLIASYGMLFLFEEQMLLIILSLFSFVFISIFAEYIFQYVHLPAKDQPYSIEYLSTILNVLTIFFLSSVGFGMFLLVQVPIWLLAIGFFIISVFIIYGTLWVSKTDEARARPYALAGALLTTELFVVLSFLPTGFYTNAAFITIFFYVFLGLTRARALHKLSPVVKKRYIWISIALLLVVIFSSQWV